MSKEIVNLNNVSFYYKHSPALKNIYLKLNQGSFLTVAGPNGSGKTTMLNIINGLKKVSSGEVEVFGRSLKSTSMINIRKKIGYIPQKQDIDPRSPISVYEAVGIGRAGKAGLFKRLKKEDQNIVKSAINTVGLQGMDEKPVGHLSGGQQQKVAIARALAQQPGILLMDEPTSSLDPRAQRNIIDLIDKVYLQKNVSIIFVTHILSHISTLCTDAALMKKGEIVWQGKRDELYNEDLLGRVYNCRFNVRYLNGRIAADPMW